MTAGAHLPIYTPAGPAGMLSSANLDYLFVCDPSSYHPIEQAGCAVSLTMPVRAQPYQSPSQLHPIFQMNLPEGYLLERLRNLLAKNSPLDPMLLLSSAAGEAAIGRVFVGGQIAPQPPEGEDLRSLLSYQGAEGLFESLFQKYLRRGALSGVQPKVLVPEQALALDKATMNTHELIVKSGLEAYPGLAINEYVCMTAVAAAGIPVPEFFLSDDRRLFVMRRFDRLPNGTPLGFEDMAVLMGLGAHQKYDRSYEAIAHTIELFTTGRNTQRSLAQLFDMVVVSCILGNGDAHLKNFGLLYADADGADATLAPAFDIVNTTCYIQDDSLALMLGGSKGLYQASLHLLDFAAKCRIPKKVATQRVLEIAQAALDTLIELKDLADEVNNLSQALRSSADRYAKTFGASTRS